MHIRVILKLFENYKCPSIAFFSSRVTDVFKEQSCFIGPHDDLLLVCNLFHFLYFIFSAPISFSLCFPISPPPLLFMLFLKLLSSIVEKLWYTYMQIISIICILENLWIFALKKMTCWFHLLAIIWIKCYISNWKSRDASSNKLLLYSTGNYSQYPVIAYKGK